MLNWPHARKRPLDDDVAFARHDDAIFRDNETVARAATPFAGGVAMADGAYILAKPTDDHDG